MISLIGQIVSPLGLAQHVDLAGQVHHSAMPAEAFLRAQPAEVPVYFDHDDTWDLGGRVVHLERSRAGGLLAVATVGNADLGDLLDDGPWFLSARTNTWADDQMPGARTCAQLVEVSMVRETANMAALPIVWVHGDIATTGAPLAPMPSSWRSAWSNAHQSLRASRYRAAPEHLEIVDLDPLDQVRTVDQADELMAQLEAAVIRTTPTPRRTRPPAKARTAPRPAGVVAHRRDQAAHYAETHGLGGYSYLGADGERRYVRTGGQLLDLDG